MHKRRLFLEAIQTQLKPLNVAGVWIQRLLPKRAVFPGITLYSEQETAEIQSIHESPRCQDRELLISVSGWIKGTADDEQAEKDMDKLAEQMEAVIKMPIGALDMALTGTDFNVDEEEAEVHAVTLSYLIRYETTEFSPTV